MYSMHAIMFCLYALYVGMCIECMHAFAFMMHPCVQIMPICTLCTHHIQSCEMRIHACHAYHACMHILHACSFACMHIIAFVLACICCHAKYMCNHGIHSVHACIWCIHACRLCIHAQHTCATCMCSNAQYACMHAMHKCLCYFLLTFVHILNAGICVRA